MFLRSLSRSKQVWGGNVATRGYKKTVEQLAKQQPGIFKNALTFVRVDFNVPLSKKDNTITDDTRIKEAIPTIKYLSDNGAKVVLASHCGRPDGKPNTKLSLKPMAERLGLLLNKSIKSASDCIGPEAAEAVGKLEGGDVLMLENTRFHKDEEGNNADFSRQLSHGAEIYVNDAFGTAHRAHASTAGVAPFCKHRVAGYLMEKELQFLKSAIDKPVHPFTAVIGGAKVSTKLPVLNSLLEKCDNILIGGAMMFTFLKAQGVSVGKSLVEEKYIPMVRELMVNAKKRNVNIIIPIDTIIAREMTAEAVSKVVSCKADTDAIPEGFSGYDIGPDTIQKFSEVLQNSKTVLWNGPMGVFEVDQFAKGTNEVAQALARVTDAGGITIVGGGDSVSAVNKAKLSAKMSHISTGGGASLELLEGAAMPGVSCLDEYQ